MRKGGGLEGCKLELEREMEGAEAVREEEPGEGGKGGRNKGGAGKRFAPLPRTFAVPHGNRASAAADWREGSTVSPKGVHPLPPCALCRSLAISTDSMRESTHNTKKQSIKGVFIDFIPSSISTRQTVRGLFCNQRLKELAEAEILDNSVKCRKKIRALNGPKSSHRSG